MRMMPSLALASACVPLGPLLQPPQADTSDTAQVVTTPDTRTTGSTADTGEVCPCPYGTCVSTGRLLVDTTWVSECTYLLQGTTIVGDETTPVILTIEAGTTILGDEATTGRLVIWRDSQLDARGNPDAPIVFTSSNPVGERQPGDWGGVVLNGRASHTRGDDHTWSDGTGTYGGSADQDTSGLLTFVRIEFAGASIGKDSWLPGLLLQGVGSKTLIDHVQVHRAQRDGILVRGGTVDLAHVLATQSGDEQLEWRDGWRGRVQFLVAQQRSPVADNAIEGLGDTDDNDALPRSRPVMSHVTAIGLPKDAASDFGLLLRQGTSAFVANTVLVGFEQACLRVEDPITLDQIAMGDLRLVHTLTDCVVPVDTEGKQLASNAEPFDVLTWFQTRPGNSLSNNQPLDEPSHTITRPFDLLTPDFTSEDNAKVKGKHVPDPFFDKVSHTGAMGSVDWSTGWASYPPS
ncbi:MAG: hypothetical protein KTR31_29655 [Myxococcales bacterium]|nr:hypothetical protein [Myxococcales bacterium]